MSELSEKVNRSLEILKNFEPQTEPYYVCYSGGKDSDVIRILCELANVKHELWHNHTTVDAPETVYYVRSIPNINISYPEKSMWKLIEDKLIPPTRLSRYCCEELKERGGQFRIKVTGVRKAESKNRSQNAGLIRILGKPKNTQSIAEKIGAEYEVTPKGGLVLNMDNSESRRVVEQCYRTTSTMVNPIIDWTDNDVWEFLNYYNCEGNPLYKCGWKRIGCIGCPMADKHRYAEFARYPKYKENYIRAFDRMLKARKEAGRTIDERWPNGEGVFRWWMGEDPAQLTFEDIQ